MKNLSLKQKYFFSIILICLVSLTVVSIASYLVSYRLVFHSTASQIKLVSERYSNEINFWLINQMDRLDDIKNDIVLHYDKDHDLNVVTILAGKLDITEGQVLDYYIGLQNKELLSGKGYQPAEDYDCTERKWYQEAMRQNGTIITVPYVDSDSQKMIITIAEPLIIDGSDMGVLAVDITIDHLVQLVNGISIEDGSYAFLIDSQNTIMTYPERKFLPTVARSYRINEILDGRLNRLGKQIQRGEYSLVRMKDYDDKEKYFYLSEIESSGWILGFSVPTSEITDNLSELLKGFALACVIAVLISILVTFIFLNALLKPVMHLTDVVKQFGQKNMNARCRIETRDEIGALGSSFNAMADTIQNYSRNLEQKVKERTRELNEKNAKLQDSIEYAKMIQQTVLPDEAEIRDILNDYFVIWRPRDIVGGDFYWMRKFDDGFLVVVGDCTGHGVPGALMTMAARAVLDRVVDEICHDNPAQILTGLDRLLNQSLRRGDSRSGIQDGLDAGIIFVPHQGEILYAGAHISLWMIRNGDVIEYKGSRKTVGAGYQENAKPFSNQQIEAAPGMSFYIATDGMKDQVGGENKLPLGKRAILRILKSIQQYPMEEQKRKLWAACEDYRNDEPFRDDITMIGFRL